MSTQKRPAEPVPDPARIRGRRPRPLHIGNSQVAQAVRAGVEAQAVWEVWYDGCELKSPESCTLAPGIEGLFAAELTHALVARIQARRDWTFHSCVYTPSTGIERKVGFDVSIGHFEHNERIRWMHKLLSSRWCDEPWNWTARPPKEGLRCANHIGLLLGQYVKDERIRPYFVLTVCHCLHEYRRMGSGLIPSVSDPKRAVIIDLSQLANIHPLINGTAAKLTTSPGSLSISRTADEQTTASWIPSDGGQSVPLETLNTQEFLEEAGDFIAPADG